MIFRNKYLMENPFRLSAFAAALFFMCADLGAAEAALQNVVRVADFGAVANDGKCDKDAIEKAVKHAKDTGAHALIFEAGVYDLKSKSLRAASPLRFENMDDFSVIGAVNEKGEPSTTLLRHYEFKNNEYGAYMLYASRCKNFTLKNVIFDNSPRYASAGEIIEKDASRVVIKIFEGNPAIEGGMIYCSNIWDLKTKKLKHVASPTYGGDTQKKADEYTLHFLNGADKSLMYLDSPTLARQAEVGDGLSWTFGYNGVQTGFLYCDNLYVENVWTYSAVGFCFETKASRNVRGKNVKFIAPDNQLMVCGRDAWKLYACTGEVVIDGMYAEGVRWDGQNAHGSFLYLKEKSDAKKALFYKQGGASVELKAGTKFGFIEGPHSETLLTVKSAEGRKAKNQEFVIEFEEEIPAFAASNSLCHVYAWTFDSYKLINSEFKNIAGCAAILRNRNTVYENCVFDNIMYPAIFIGAAPNEGEGIIPQNVTVKKCRFISSGWMARQGVTGALGIRSSNIKELNEYSKNYVRLKVEPVFYMRNISVLSNTFEDCDIGVNAEGVDGLKITGNIFKKVKTPIVESMNLNADISSNKFE